MQNDAVLGGRNPMTLLRSVCTLFSGEKSAYRIIFTSIVLFLSLMLVYPVITVLFQAFTQDGQLTLAHWVSLVTKPGFGEMLANSFQVATSSALISVVIAFFVAYGLTFSNLPERCKRWMHIVMLVPLFLPSITYGFAVIYSFGRMGLVTMWLGQLPFSIYGFWGLLIADVIYTLPMSFLIIYNSLRYVDRRFVIVSTLMADPWWRTFYMTAVRPALGAIVSAFVLAFFLGFTDFGIPISIAGNYPVLATELYATMMGAVPNFGQGGVLAMVMLIPSAIAVFILKRADRLNFRYNGISQQLPTVNWVRDIGYAIYFLVIAGIMLAVFAVIFVVPFVEFWPYQPTFTLRHFKEALLEGDVLTLYLRSVGVALVGAAVGTILCFGAAMIRTRSNMPGICRTLMDWFAMLTSTLPGMVLGVGYLFAFTATSLHNTVLILVLANIVHFMATPYLMGTTALSKMNARWETTASLMGDTWLRSVCRIIVPNARTTLIQMFETIFVNSMVTISAIVFLASTQTMVLTTRIKELQYFDRFDQIFVLSVLIFVTNVFVKAILDRIAHGRVAISKSR